MNREHPANNREYHATVFMTGRGPFSRAVQHVQDIRELNTFKISDVVPELADEAGPIGKTCAFTVYMYSGRIWVQRASRWYLIVGVAVIPDKEVALHDYPYEQAVWAGTWQ